jgi:hypothetical protein
MKEFNIDDNMIEVEDDVIKFIKDMLEDDHEILELLR